MKKSELILSAIFFVLFIGFVASLNIIDNEKEAYVDEIRELKGVIEAKENKVNELLDSIDITLKRVKKSEEIVIFLNDEVARLHGRNYLSYIGTEY